MTIFKAIDISISSCEWKGKFVKGIYFSTCTNWEPMTEPICRPPGVS